MSINNHVSRAVNFRQNVCYLFLLSILLLIFGTFAAKVPAQDADSQKQNERAEDLAFFAQRISHGSTEQKRDALFELRNLASTDAARVALPSLQDSSDIVRATAVSSVIYLPADEAADNLIPLLKDKSDLVRRETAYALGKTKSVKAVPPLRETLQADKIFEVRTASAAALGEIGDISAVEALTGMLEKKPKDAEDFLRRAEARAIGQIARIIQTGQVQVITPTGFLPDKYRVIDNPSYKNLVESFPAFRSAVSILIQVLQNPKESGDTRREAAFALGEIRDNSAISILQANLNSEDYYLAKICREALDKINQI